MRLPRPPPTSYLYSSPHHQASQFMVDNDFLAKKKEMLTRRHHYRHDASTSTTTQINENTMSSSSSSSQLIVDFPTQPRHYQNLKEAAAPKKEKKKKKTVRFVEYSELALFEPYRPNELNELWYNESDKIEFKRQRMEDVIFTHKMITASKNKLHGRITITGEQICRSIGVENIVTGNKARGIANRQRRHAQTILLNQDTCTPDELCAMSRHGSKQSRLRACVVASTWAKYQLEEGLCCIDSSKRYPSAA